MLPWQLLEAQPPGPLYFPTGEVWPAAASGERETNPNGVPRVGDICGRLRREWAFRASLLNGIEQ